MIKKIFDIFLNSSFDEKKILFKEIFLTSDNENIIRTIKTLKKDNKINHKNPLIIDIGCFDGKTAVQFSKAFPEAHIVSFEPNIDAYNIALMNCKNHKNISIQNIALSNSNGVANLNVTLNKVSSSLNFINKNEINSAIQEKQLEVKKQVNINTITLDSLKIDQEILLLKIDTQGHELKVLEGAIQSLKRVNYILIEMNNHSIYEESAKYYQIDDYLRSNGFKLVDIIVTYRKGGILLMEYDAIYRKDLN